MTGVLISLDETRASRAHGNRHREVRDTAESALLAGGFIALCGGVGSGKTTMMHRLQQRLNDEKYVVVAQSLPIDKARVTPATVVTALLRDLRSDEHTRFPAESEARARALRDLVEKRKQPIALFIDDAHDLRPATLIEIKRIRELIECDAAKLSVALAGRPTLQSALHRAGMRYRAEIFMLDCAEKP